MTAVLTNNLPLLAGAPNGIKKLRELILELAVRGKLVPQDSSDEPASELLKRIAEAKARLTADGVLKKQKTLPEVSEDERLFELPPGWAWCRLQDAFDVRDGTHDSPKYHSSGYPLVTSKNLYTGKLDLTDVKFISEEDHQKISARSKVDRGDVLFAMIGSIGNPAIVDTDIPFSIKNVALLKQYTHGKIRSEFLLIYLLVAAAVMREKSAGGVQSFVSLGSIRLYPFALPALNEQHRIVTKVDELMALCDRLEAQQADSENAHAQLVQALLDSLTQASDAADFGANWQRLAEHFHTLFTTEPSINALKQTLLQLAVMGKLVPQDPSDEPASELLEKINHEKARLYAEGKIRKPKQAESVSTEDQVFNTPLGWAWTRLSQITTQLGDGLHGTPTYSSGGEYYFVNGNNLKNGRIVIKPETKTVSESEFTKYKKPLDDRSVLVSINGTIGNVAFYDTEKIVLGKSACYFNLASEVYKNFIRLLIEAPGFIEYANKSATGTTIKNLGLKAMNDYPLALPPTEEQHRIVAKVDQLMVLCDQLQTRLTQARKLNEQLANTLVEQAVS